MEASLVITSTGALDINANLDHIYENNNNVRFKVSYSKEYKGHRFLTDGETISVSKEVALDFTRRGIGNTIDDASVEIKTSEMDNRTQVDPVDTDGKVDDISDVLTKKRGRPKKK